MERNISFNRLASLRHEILDLGAVFCGGSFAQSSCGDPDSLRTFRSNREMLACLWNVRILTYEACNLHGISSGWWGYLQNIYSEWEMVRNALASRFMFLVKSVARKYGHPNQDFGDLVQEGAKGLLRALDSFDVEYGVPFEAYARLWIRKYLGKCVECDSEIVRIPESAVKRCRKKRRAAKENDAGVVTLSYVNEVAGNLEFVSDYQIVDNRMNTEQRFCHQETLRFLNRCVQTLDSTSQKVLRLHYCPENKPSLESVGKKCGYSREKTRKIEKRALKMLKNRMKNLQ